jgi:PAS domain S-box-containing protein
LLTILVAFTNPWTALLWEYLSYDPQTGILIRNGGIYFPVLAVYSYLLILGSILLLLRAVIVFRNGFRAQAITTLIAASFPVIANLIYVFGSETIKQFDLTPYAFVLSGIVLAWSIQHFQYLNPLPIARDDLVEIMIEAVIVLNNQNQVTYLNKAAATIIGVPLDQAVGQQSAQILLNWPFLTNRFKDYAAGEDETVESLGKDGRWYEIRIRWLRNQRGKITGSMIVIHDITRGKSLELVQTKLADGLHTVAEVSTAMATALNTETLLLMVAKLTRERFGFYHAQIYLLDKEGENLTLTTGSGEIGKQMVSQGRNIPVSQEPSLVARAARTKQSVIVNDVSANVDFLPHPLLTETRAELAVPILANEQLLGILDVQDSIKDRFTQQDVNILTSLAAQVSVALQNAAAFTQLQMLLDARQKELSLFYALGEKVAEALPIRQLLEWTAAQIPTAMRRPEACAAAILYQGQILGQEKAAQAIDALAQEILLAGEPVGRVFVAYQAPHTFQKVEENLLANVVQRLQNYIGELTLRERQAQLSEALQIAHMGHFELDLLSGILTLSDEFYSILGTTETDEHGYQMSLDGLLKFIHPEDLQKAKRDFRNILKSKDHAIIELEYRFLLYEGARESIRNFILRGQVHQDNQGKIKTLTGTIQDITERVKADAEVIRLATVIEQAKEAIVITDLKGDIVYANPYFEYITGYPVREVLGQNPRFLKSGQQDTAFYKILWETITRGETWNGTFINKRKDGSVYYESATIFPIKDTTGKFINYATVKRDISEQVAAEREVRAFARQQALLNDITLAALEQTDFVSMLNILAQRLGELYEADGCYITLWDEQKHTPVPVAAYGNLSEVYPTMEAEPGDETLTGSVIKVGHPLAVDDVYDTPFISPRVAAMFPTHSALGLPLIASGKNLGAAMITFGKYHHFTSAEISQGEQAAAQISLALMKGQLLDEEQKQRHLAERLQETGRILSTTLDLDHLLELILDQIHDFVPYDIGSLMLLEGETARVIRTRWIDRPSSGNTSDLSIPEKINLQEVKCFKEIIQNRSPVMVEDVHYCPGLDQYFSSTNIRSWIGAPILTSEDLIGFLSLAKTTAAFYHQEYASRLTAFAGQASLALQNSRLFETAQRRAKEAETLRQAASAITRSLKTEETMEIILEQLNLVVPYDSASVLLLRGDALEIVGGHGFPNPTEVLGLKFSIYGNNPSAVVYSTQQPYLLDDAPRIYPVFLEAPHNRIRSWLGVPLIVQGRMTGMIALDSYQVNTFTQDHARLAAAYADQVAIALENARLFAQTQELAITDPLTGLYNRRFFFSQAKAEFERARRYQEPLSIIMLDIDDFKKINDTYGHLVGDQVLQTLAKICRENLREIDIVGRYGGEEFVILLPETPLVISSPSSLGSTNFSEERLIDSGAVTAAERLRVKVSQSIIQTERARLHITISLGVAEYQPEYSSPEMLLDQADKALYKAKQAGKNRVEISGRT